MIGRKGVDRRDFLKISVAASGGLLIGFQFPGVGTLAMAQPLSAQPASANVFMPNAFVRIGTDERVTVIVNHSEMGQGVYTSLPMLLAEELEGDGAKVGFDFLSQQHGQRRINALAMLLAEELDADWAKVGFEPAPVDPKYNHPAFGMQMTGGSSSVWSGLEQFRQAGAAARAMLVAAAAQQWNVDASTCLNCS